MVWLVRLVIRPVIITGFLILILVGLDASTDKIVLPVSVGWTLTVVTYLLSAMFGNILEEVLRPTKRRLQAFFGDWPYAYKLYAQFTTSTEPSMVEIIRYLNTHKSWAQRFNVTFRGYNYVQAEFASPAVALIISFQPQYSYENEANDEDAEEIQSFVVEVRPVGTVSFWFRFHRAAKDLEETLRLVAEISNELSRELNGSRARLTVNVNRYIDGKKIISKGPTHQGPPKRISGLTIYKDLYAMQLISESPGDVKNHLFDNLIDLEPVQAA